ncbi:MAG: Lrp/AsnC ligand binding domain-containing protein [Nitrosopumilaceae archaeon]
MNEAYVLLNTDYKKQKEIIEKAKKIPVAKVVKTLYGIYNILVIFESDDMQKIKQAIDEDLHNLDGITNITSLITID